MKKSKFVSFFITVVMCLGLLTIPSFAMEYRASAQISIYDIKVTPVTNSIVVTFSVTGRGTMEKLGWESIEIYEKIGSRWDEIASCDENDEDMSIFNNASYTNSISFDGERGVEYMVKVTIFAENSAGRDTRSRTFYVTGQ